LEEIVSEEPDQRKRPSRKERLSPEALQKLSDAKKSYWPFALAVAVSIALFGVVIQPAIIGTIITCIGALLAVIAVIGWGLERR
jgi:hypothetical protein